MDFDGFIRSLQRASAAPLPRSRVQAEVEAIVREAARTPEIIPAAYRALPSAWSPPVPARYALHRSVGLFVNTVVWGPGSSMGAHDHVLWGVMGMLEGSIEETRFDLAEPISSPGRASLVSRGPRALSAGMTALLQPGQDEIHAVRNTTAAQAVELLVYGGEFVGLMRRSFDVEAGTYTMVSSGAYDNC